MVICTYWGLGFHSDPRINLSISSAAFLPSATALMIRRGPKAMSPAANIPGAVLIKVLGSILMMPCRVVSTPSLGVRNDKSDACPMARMAVSQEITDSVPASKVGLKRWLASKTEVHLIV